MVADATDHSDDDVSCAASVAAAAARPICDAIDRTPSAQPPTTAVATGGALSGASPGIHGDMNGSLQPPALEPPPGLPRPEQARRQGHIILSTLNSSLISSTAFECHAEANAVAEAAGAASAPDCRPL